MQRQKAEGWGAKVVDRLSVDLNREFPDQKGFSSRNLKYMRKFAESFPDRGIVQQAAAQIPWFHNCVILDLLFYHMHLRCYMVIDLKVVPFKPEFAGKMNFYLSAVDDQLRHPDDQPSIGLILCKERNRLVVEYALRDAKKPMGVATYRVLARKLKGELPTARQIEKGIGKT